MDTEHLEIFIDVLRKGSLTAAARSRDLDPSMVSRVIGSLEAELGTKLFQRTTRQLSPTEAGVRFFQHVEPMLEELARARAMAVEVADKPRGTIRICAPVSFSLLNVVPLLPEFSERYPELAIDLILTDNALDLVTERIDLAIRLGPLADSGMVAQRLAPMVSCVCAAPSYLQARRKPRSPHELAQHDCLILDMPGFTSTWRFRAADDTQTRVTVSGRMRSSNAVALKQCAVMGMGVILQARWIVAPELQAGTLVELFPRYRVTAANFEDPAMWLLYPSRTYTPEKVKVLAAFLREKFRHGSPVESDPKMKRNFGLA